LKLRISQSDPTTFGGFQSEFRPVGNHVSLPRRSGAATNGGSLSQR
jgi:hypothetical protein